MDKLNNTTFSREVKSNPNDSIKVEVGDAKQTDFKPQFKVMRWDNEVNFSIRAEEHPEAIIETEGDVIKYITPKYEVHQYEKPEAGEDGGFEFEWLLLEKPEANILTTTVQSKGLDFLYQPALTQEEIDNGTKRPENVIGSYAVYHSTKGGLNDVSSMEYKTGKVAHIYRPKATDADQNETWCELNIENGILAVTVSKDFLDKATYPIKVDPTFGYTSQGASTLQMSSGSFDGKMAQRGDSITGTLTKISAYLKNSGATSGNNYQMELLDNSGSDKPNTSLVIGSTVLFTETVFTLKEQNLSYSMTGSVYWVSANAGKLDFFSNVQGAFDTGGVANYGATYASDGGTWTLDSNKYSVYATYTATATSGRLVAGTRLTSGNRRSAGTRLSSGTRLKVT